MKRYGNKCQGVFSCHFPTDIHLHHEPWGTDGGIISKEDIDQLASYSEADRVTVSGLRQDSFEYLIRTVGPQLKAIIFIKNKLVEDWSLLGTLPQLEYAYWFANQRIDSVWDMRNNHALKGLTIHDFSRLHSISGIEKAPALRYLSIGNAIWPNMVVDSLMPLAKTKITHLEFFGKKIEDGNLSFFENLPQLQRFDCPLHLLPTEQFAWIAANCPQAEGRALHAKEDGPVYKTINGKLNELPGTFIVGKRKPCLPFEGNEARIQQYVDEFEKMKIKYRGISFEEAFMHSIQWS